MAQTQKKFNNNAIILDEILNRQHYLEDKSGIWFVKTRNELCNKGESSLNQKGDFHIKYELHAMTEKPSYVNASDKRILSNVGDVILLDI